MPRKTGIEANERVRSIGSLSKGIRQGPPVFRVAGLGIVVGWMQARIQHKDEYACSRKIAEKWLRKKRKVQTRIPRTKLFASNEIVPGIIEHHVAFGAV